MNPSLLTLEIITYSLALWLGLHLLARDGLRYAAFGILAYAVSLATDMLATQAPTEALAVTFARLHWPLLFLPALFWLIATLCLLPEEANLPLNLADKWPGGLLLILIPFYLVSAGTNLIFDFSSQPPQAGPAYLIFAAVVLLPLLLALGLIGSAFRRSHSQTPLGLLLVATIFFGLSVGLLIFPLGWLPRSWLLIAMCFDLAVLGLVLARLEAAEAGEALLWDFARSFDAALLASLIFGGLVGLTIWLSTGLTLAMLLLLLGVISAAIAGQTLAEVIQNGLDQVAFATVPQLRRERADLRAVASALPRRNDHLILDTLDEAKFIRLTRRALSHFGDLSRLAASPLTRLPLIEVRLAQRQAGDDTLERATELKRLLTESICRLKPPGKGDFGTTDEWRYYNALYFPYVAGLKPYSRRAEYDDNGLSPAEQEALAWFRTYVPERTLYNWQNAAAKLVAQDIREKT